MRGQKSDTCIYGRYRLYQEEIQYYVYVVHPCCLFVIEGLSSLSVDVQLYRDLYQLRKLGCTGIKAGV